MHARTRSTSLALCALLLVACQAEPSAPTATTTHATLVTPADARPTQSIAPWSAAEAGWLSASADLPDRAVSVGVRQGMRWVVVPAEAELLPLGAAKARAQLLAGRGNKSGEAVRGEGWGGEG